MPPVAALAHPVPLDRACRPETASRPSLLLEVMGLPWRLLRLGQAASAAGLVLRRHRGALGAAMEERLILHRRAADL